MRDEQRAAYQENLDVCFIVRMPRELRDLVTEHAGWMAKRRKVDAVSLAAASRDLLRRGLMTTPGGHERRRERREALRREKEQRSPQLRMFND